MHIALLINDITKEILRRLGLKELISFGSTCTRFRNLVKDTPWTHITIRNFRYFISGYTFRKCHLLRLYDYTDTDVYSTGYQNLAKCRLVKLKYAMIDEILFKILHTVRELVLINCKFSLRDGEYKIPTGMKISILRCKEVPNDLIRRTRIHQLSLYYSDFNDELFEYISNVNILKIWHVGDFNRNELIQLTNVRSLHIDYPALDDNDLECLGTIRNLYLGYNIFVTDHGMKYLRNVKQLSLTSNKKITDIGVSYLANIDKIDLAECTNITNNALFTMCNAISVNLSGCNLITDDGIIHLRNVRKLDLSDCIQITDTGLTGLKYIRELYLGNCSQITDAVLKNFANVTVLDLRGCTEITGNGFKYLTSIRDLNIIDCEKIDTTYFKHLRHLDKISLGGCSQITDSELEYFSNANYVILCRCAITDHGIQYLHSVRRLFLSDMDLVTGSSFQHLAKLDWLKIMGCHGISPHNVENLDKIAELIIFNCDQMVRGFQIYNSNYFEKKPLPIIS